MRDSGSAAGQRAWEDTRCSSTHFAAELAEPIASWPTLALNLLCYVFKNRVLTLRPHVGELNSVAFLVYPDHRTDSVNSNTR